MRMWMVPVTVELEANTASEAESMVGSALEELIVLDEDGNEVQRYSDVGFAFRSLREVPS